MNKCDKQQLLYYSHSTDVTMFYECEVKYSKEETIIKDMRENNDDPCSINESIDSLPDIEKLSEAPNRKRDLPTLHGIR